MSNQVSDPFFSSPRLQSVQNRPGIRATLAEKFVEIFNWYEADLEEVQKIYETHKVTLISLCSWKTEFNVCL
ncbi:hypothetical protein DPMN_055573 [Dreissena polymorpha]|uniref:Uncharacterized protein n=1 Tax=Dreissena polymorpha TaxID=45954 RepID=A0A9D4CRM4_DREPO|nr:hypothetical protein DPMN_055573 [Dreissena polymorpha]